MDIPDTTDEDVARLVQQGNVEAYGILMGRYEPRLTRYGRKFLAREEDITDLVQDIFVKVYQNIQSFDTTRRFSPWIYRIAHNTFINELKQARLRPHLLPDFDLLVSHTIYEDPAQEERDRVFVREVLEESLDTMSQKYREILVLRYFEEMDYKDIADILHIPIGTVSVRIQRAKQALKKIITHTSI